MDDNDDFDEGDRVVVKDMPDLLGEGVVIPTPTYSHPRLTWARFGGTDCAFEPGELKLVTP